MNDNGNNVEQEKYYNNDSYYSNNNYSYNKEYIYIIRIGNNIIKAAGNHPFYLNGKYVEAKVLKVGDKLLTKNGTYDAIEQIVIYQSDELVYNIQVENNHNYFVGETGYLVHNRQVK